MKLWVDDIRPAPEGWSRAETISEAVNFIERYCNEITHISLDHDISIPVKVGDLLRPYPSPDTFQVVAKYLARVYEEQNSPIITVHSSNPEGRKHIVAILDGAGIECEETPLERAVRK